ncbi:MAG: hypothetical protein NT007_16980 [Candidatus Kapabacteria bacterium]|nr:hypothetical protein [Candidatus Kapabacteria bacterium]
MFFILLLAFCAAAANAGDILWSRVSNPIYYTFVNYSTDGRYIATGGSDGNVLLYDAQNGAFVYTFQKDSDDTLGNNNKFNRKSFLYRGAIK